MKKPILFILLIAAIFTSCSSDDDSFNILNITKANIVGKWQWTASTENGKAVTLNKCDLMDTVEYKNDDTASYISHSLNGDTCSEFLFTSSWSLSNSTISYETGDEPETVVELTSEILKVQFIETDGDKKTTYVDTYKKV